MKKELVYFIDADHSYYGVDTGLRYESVSGVAKKILTPYTDWDQILIRKANKLGVTPEELQAEWDLKRIEGTRAGTALHNKFESEDFSRPITLFRGDFYDVHKYEMIGDKKMQIPEISRGGCYPELILSLTKDHMRIAGQTDKLFIDYNGYVHILDYKTDKSIDYSGFMGSKLKAPFNKIEDCNYNTYAMKMSTYMKMTLLSNPDLKPGTITLLHTPIERDERGLPIWDGDLPKLIKIEEIAIYYNVWEKEVEKMFNEYYKLTK